jgi:hypothetical protein
MGNRASTVTVIAYGGALAVPRPTHCRIALSDESTTDRDALQVFSSKTRPALGLPSTTRPLLAIRIASMDSQRRVISSSLHK